MSKIALSGDPSGTGTFTLTSPNSSTDRTLTLPDESGTVLTSGGAIDVNASAPADSVAIDSSGNVGIGVVPSSDWRTSDRKNLQISGGAISAGETFTVLYSNTVLDASAVSKYLYNGAAASYSQSSTGHIWSTAASGTAGNTITFTERARITSGGTLLVGTTTATATSKVEAYKTGTVTCFLATQGDAGEYCYTSRAANNSGTYYHFNFTEAGTQRGSITSNGSATAYNTGSDYRLKDNIAPLTGALATVLQLQPRVWTWKTNGSDGQGFIAHELAEIVPDCVTGEKDAVDADGNPQYQGVDTSFLVATLTAAIQELKAINDAQASRIETLEAKVAALEAK